MLDSHTEEYTIPAPVVQFGGIDLEASPQTCRDVKLRNAIDIGPIVRADRISFGEIRSVAGLQAFSEAVELIGGIRKHVKATPRYPATAETINKILARQRAAESLLGELDAALEAIKLEGSVVTYSLELTKIVDEGDFGRTLFYGWVCALSILQADK